MLFEDRPLVYVAGPFEKPNSAQNTRRAILIADSLNHHGYVTAHVPHMNLFWDFVAPHDSDYWYDYDMAVLVRSDALYRMKGESPGADEEVLKATKLGIPVFYDPVTLHEWARDWK